MTSARIELPHQESPKGSGSQISFRGLSAAGSQMSLMTGNGSVGLANKFRNKALRERRRSVHSVDASQVLEALHDNETDVEHFFRTTDSIERIFKEWEPIEGAPESKFTRFDSEYNRMSCYDKLRFWLQSHKFDFLITGFLCLNVIFMGFELQFSGSVTGVQIEFFKHLVVPESWWPSVETFFVVGDQMFTALFTIDVGVRILVLRLKFWMNCMNYIDVLVTLASLVEQIITAVTPVNPTLFRLLRIGKLARALRLVTMSNTLASLELLTKCLQSSVDMLFWSFALLTCIQCVAGMVVSALCRSFIEDPAQNIEVRQEVFRYYGTFTRTFLSMFEILFANWGPPCRVVVENISEWFSVFFLLYRCVLGFAVLNVVNAVFVQQTMKTASSDEELAFKQKERDVAMYTRKVKKLFDTMDDEGDGALSLEEFTKLAQSPKLKFWMSQLELEYHDLLSLFEFLDNGDGQITPTEFIEGAARLRGSAKAVDIWRLETKMEVLFGEVLKQLAGDEEDQPQMTESEKVQRVFAASKYQHIHSISVSRNSAKNDEAMEDE